MTLSWSLSLVSRQSGPAAAAAPKTAPKSNAGCREADEELQSEPTAEAIFVAFLVNAPLAFMPSLPHPSHAVPTVPNAVMQPPPPFLRFCLLSQLP